MVVKQKAIIYYSPAARRRFFTKKAAINNEVMAIIRRKYPTERFEPDTGYSFDCRDMEGFQKIYRRLYRLVLRSII